MMHLAFNGGIDAGTGPGSILSAVQLEGQLI